MLPFLAVRNTLLRQNWSLPSCWQSLFPVSLPVLFRVQIRCYSHGPLLFALLQQTLAVMYGIYLLFCILRIVIIKHRWFLAFFSWRLAFRCTITHFVMHTVSRPTDNWFCLCCFLWSCSNKVEFSKQSHTQTLWRILVLWKDKTNLCVGI
jgi:hypothetical protein